MSSDVLGAVASLALAAATALLLPAAPPAPAYVHACALHWAHPIGILSSSSPEADEVETNTTEPVGAPASFGVSQLLRTIGLLLCDVLSHSYH
jgi:hypothetical protein